jgi:hypothetical protein
MRVFMGIKELDVGNWLHADAASSSFYTIQGDAARQMQGEDWARHILAEDLGTDVPDEVRKLFYVSRGAMLYGWYFYPLYTLGMEQMTRVLDAAAGAKCALIGAPVGVRMFQNRVEYLVSRGAIARSDADRWLCHVQMRNLASHPEDQAVFSPGMVLGLLRQFSEDINTLFAARP